MLLDKTNLQHSCDLVHCLNETVQAGPRWLQNAVKRVAMYWNMYRQGRPTLTDRRDAPDEWCGLVSHRMNEKEKACDYFDPKRSSEIMEDMIRSFWPIVTVRAILTIVIGNRYCEIQIRIVIAGHSVS